MGVVFGQNLGQIRSNVAKKVKKLALSIGFSHILHWEYKHLSGNLRQIARNNTFQEY